MEKENANPPYSWVHFEETDGTINIQHPVFQQGRNLYEAQLLLAQIDANQPVDLTLVRKVARETCYLINGVGQLRTGYDSLRTQLKQLKDRIKQLQDSL